jgi:hypothetical protein
MFLLSANKKLNGFFNADMAFRQGKVLIQNAEDFYAWAKQTRKMEARSSIYFIIKKTLTMATKYCKKKKTLCRLQEHSGYTL